MGLCLSVMPPVIPLRREVRVEGKAAPGRRCPASRPDASTDGWTESRGGINKQTDSKVAARSVSLDSAGVRRGVEGADRQDR